MAKKLEEAKKEIIKKARGKAEEEKAPKVIKAKASGMTEEVRKRLKSFKARVKYMCYMDHPALGDRPEIGLDNILWKLRAKGLNSVYTVSKEKPGQISYQIDDAPVKTGAPDQVLALMQEWS